jgi:hypothetical protein
MDPGKRLALAIAVGTFTVVGWLMLIVSFWTPTEFAHLALLNTSLAMLIPGMVGSAITAVFWDDMVRPITKPQLRCTDCGTKILSPAGTTIGDKIEDELLVGQWEPPKDASPFHRGGH